MVLAVDQRNVYGRFRELLGNREPAETGADNDNARSRTRSGMIGCEAQTRPVAGC
jgi:hypothetical protein